MIDQPRDKILRYTVDAQDLPSVEIIANVAFHHVGQQSDEIDGPEVLFEMSVSELGAKVVTAMDRPGIDPRIRATKSGFSMLTHETLTARLWHQ